MKLLKFFFVTLRNWEAKSNHIFLWNRRELILPIHLDQLLDLFLFESFKVFYFLKIALIKVLGYLIEIDLWFVSNTILRCFWILFLWMLKLNLALWICIPFLKEWVNITDLFYLFMINLFFILVNLNFLVLNIFLLTSYLIDKSKDSFIMFLRGINFFLDFDPKAFFIASFCFSWS